MCAELGLPPLVASTTGTAWQWKWVKRKTDRDDALKLARLAAVGEQNGVPVPPRPGREQLKEPEDVQGPHPRNLTGHARGGKRVSRRWRPAPGAPRPG
jgi:hypothetical protein